MGIIIVRVFMLAAAAGAGLAFGPSLGFHATNWWLGGAGFLFGCLPCSSNGRRAAFR